MTLREKIALFPHSPGVYRYYDSEGIVIYVGKAKDLHKRVAQYFAPPERLTAKTRILVSKIADAQYSVVDSEADALLLENNLIKQYRPKYNILLKDSKTYPWICVTGDEFPKVYLTRRVVKGNRYFGPYSSVMHARNLLEFFHANYKIRSCNHKLTSDAILRGRYRPCLDFHIGRCAGCCAGKISAAEYNAGIEEIVSLLKGGVNEIIQHYRHLMRDAADRLEFEQAQIYKEKADSLQQHYSKSVVTAASDVDVDVFSLVQDASEAYGNFIRVRGGAIIQSLNLGFKLNIEEEPASILSEFIAEIESKFGKIAGEVIVPFLPDVEMEGVRFRIPVKGDTLALLLDRGENNSKPWKLEEVSSALGMTTRTLNHLKKRFVTEGLERALNRKPQERPSRQVKFDGEFEAKLTLLACSDPPKGYKRWTVRLLADKAVELEFTDKISPMSVQRLLKKKNLSLTWGITGKSRKDVPENLLQGWRMCSMCTQGLMTLNGL